MPLGFHSLRDNPISNAVLGSPVANQPGVGGKAPNANNLVHDPTTGLYFDPTSGTTYADPNGYTPVTDPNVAQQVATNYARSQAFNNQLPGLENEREHVYGGQEALGQTFRDVIAGRAPSVAAMQAQQGYQTIANQQLAQVAGGNSASTPLLEMLAARNTGSASIGANNTAAMARTKEEQDAANAYIQLLHSQGAGVAADLNRVTGAGTDYANLAATGQAGNQGLNFNAATNRANSAEKFGYGFLKSASSAFDPSGGGGGSGAGAGVGANPGDELAVPAFA